MSINFAVSEQMASNDATLTPEMIVQSYEQAYFRVYGQTPRIRHIGGPWYYISGETVHRLALINEITRLHELAKPPQPAYTPPNRSVIQKLISRLRGL
jgi:hypothetical protein